MVNRASSERVLIAATPASLVALDATSGQRTAAGLLSIVLVASTLAALGSDRGARFVIPSFIPVWATVTALTDVLAAAFIFQQFAATRLRAFALSGSAYALNALLTFGYLLSFPGTLVSGRALVGTEQSAIWLWVLWHLSFAVVVGWALWGDPSLNASVPADRMRATSRRIAFGLLAVTALAWYAAFAYAAYLPPLVVQGRFEPAFRLFWAPLIVLADAGVACLLLARTRGRTLFYLALAVALVTAGCDALLNVASSARYSPSWYAGKVEAFLTAAIVVTALFGEITNLFRLVQRNDEELQSLNKELESFSYSVSHDLRAPLRAFTGFLQILDEDHAATLDDDGRRCIGILNGEAKRMAQLIDDLLEFSRLGRQRIELAHIDMTRLVQAVAQEEQIRAKAERLVIDIDVLPQAHGDPALLRHVWQNLISNAIKYSSKRDAPVVRIRGSVRDGEAVYEVRDNGAGFDMSQVDRLFGAFQRLHAPQDFPGTGVGLAIVERIVTRHDGRIWADARIGEGATFWFTLRHAA